jgi:hypothetical protein
LADKGERSGDVAPTLNKCKQLYATVKGQPAARETDGRLS